MHFLSFHCSESKYLSKMRKFTRDLLEIVCDNPNGILMTSYRIKFRLRDKKKLNMCAALEAECQIIEMRE